MVKEKGGLTPPPFTKPVMNSNRPKANHRHKCIKNF